MPDVGASIEAFLFTDIESSTELWERNPAGMSVQLGVHDAIVRETMRSFGGDPFKHTGDGLAVAFTACSDAVAGAIALQRTIETHPWPEDCRIRIRIGIHRGPSERRDTHYFGRTLNWAARVMDSGHGGQIVISDEVRGAVDRRMVECRFRDEGTHQLKGLSSPIALFSVSADGLRADFPPLRTPLDLAANTIPVALTEIIGRDSELNSITERLERHRLVTLVGPGGAGKTRLAIEAGALASDRFTGGRHMVELAALRDPESIASAVAERILGVDAFADPQAIRGRLLQAMARPMLLVLDNCEHLLDGVAAFVADYLRSAPNLVVLATSREPLSVPGEEPVVVGPLEAGSAATSAAVQLFVQRARSAAPMHGPFDLEKVAAICTRLDGLPLAIELAAARVGVLTLDDLSARLFEVLRTASRRDRRREGRHATIDAAIEWSYSLLDETEKLVLARASVFVGSFGFDAAAAVCGVGLSSLETIEILTSLVDRSFISPVYAEAGNRLRLLEVIRAFAADQLEESATAEVRAVHQQHYLKSTLPLAFALDQKPDATVIAALEADDANVVAALRLRTTRAEVNNARKLFLQLHTYFEETGRMGEALTYARELLQPRDDTSRLWRAMLGTSISYAAMAGRLHEVPADEEQLTELLSPQRDLTAVNAYIALGFASLGRARFEEAIEWFEAAAEVIEPLDRNSARQWLMTAGACAAYDQNPLRARQYYAKARALPGEPQGWFGAFHEAFDRSAAVQLDPSSADVNLPLIFDGLDHLLGLGLGFRITIAALQAMIAMELGGDAEAVDRWWRITLNEARRNGHLWGVVVSLEHAGWSAARSGDDDLAVTRWAVGDTALERAGFRLPAATITLGTPIREMVRARMGERYSEVAGAARTLDFVSFAASPVLATRH